MLAHAAGPDYKGPRHLSDTSPPRMNYRHAYHAGNQTEMLKHGTLVLVLEHLRKKDKPFFVLDTHAGLGAYDLRSVEAGKTNEAEAGIRRVAAAAPPMLAGLLALVRDTARERGGDWYPGSPEITRRMLRPQDRLIACELHPADVEILRANCDHDPLVSVQHRDGYEALKAHLPPKERRGLVFIDPPYETRDETDRLARGLAKAVRKWPTGTFVVWYPLKTPDAAAPLVQSLRAIPAPPCLRVELRTRPFDGSLVGGGLVVVNPPYTLPEGLDRMGGELLEAFGAEGDGGYVREWVVGEG